MKKIATFILYIPATLMGIIGLALFTVSIGLLSLAVKIAQLMEVLGDE